MSGLPPRRAQKDAERDWVCEQLDLIVSPPTKFEIPKDLDVEKLQLLKYRALSEAISGDVTKLRQLVSHLLGTEFADFIQPRPLKRGQKEYPPRADLSWVIMSLIKTIWRKHHNKRRYRHRGDGYTDEEIAAYYLGIPEENAEEIVSKNPLLRRKKKPRAR
jgi:hypothetical protein